MSERDRLQKHLSEKFMLSPSNDECDEILAAIKKPELPDGGRDILRSLRDGAGSAIRYTAGWRWTCDDGYQSSYGCGYAQAITKLIDTGLLRKAGAFSGRGFTHCAEITTEGREAIR